jgi:hypothetical protein
VSLVPVTVHIWCMSRSCNSSGPKPSLKGPHNLSPLLTISISLQCDWPKSCRKKAVPISNHSPSCLIETPTSYVLIHHMLTFRDISQNANQRSGTFCRMRLERFSSPSMQPNWPGSLWHPFVPFLHRLNCLGRSFWCSVSESQQAWSPHFLGIGGQLPHIC